MNAGISACFFLFIHYRTSAHRRVIFRWVFPLQITQPRTFMNMQTICFHVELKTQQVDIQY